MNCTVDVGGNTDQLVLTVTNPQTGGSTSTPLVSVTP
jgi:hypothetical protein